MSFELAGSPRNKTRSEKHKNSTWNIWWERQEILSQAMALRRTSHLFGKQNYPILTSRTYDSKMVPTFDHRLLCFMWPPLDPPPCYFMYIFGSYRSFVLVARLVLFRSFCFLISVVSHVSFRFAVSFLHPGCLRGSHQPKKQKILGKHDLKLEIVMFSIVNSTAFVFQQLSFTSNHLRLFHRIWLSGTFQKPCTGLSKI